MKQNLFFINTEYHFLLALSIVFDNFSGDDYKNTFVLLESKSGRLANILDNNTYRFLEIQRLNADKDNVKKHLDSLVEKKYENFFHFFEFNILTSYVISKLNKDCKKVYCEDGTAIYQKYSRLGIGSGLQRLVQDYKKAFKLNIFHTSIRFQGLVHGKSGYIDELWLTQPEMYQALYKPKKKVKKINLLHSEGQLAFVKTFFAEVRQDLPSQNVIFFLGRVSYGDDYLKGELDLLKKIQSGFRHEHFLMKIHPLTKKPQKEAYAKLPGVTIIEDKIPAEILLAGLKNSTIIGVDSTALYFKNANCRSYVLYKYLQEKGVYPTYRTIPFPDHVKFFEENDLQNNQDQV